MATSLKTYLAGEPLQLWESEKPKRPLLVSIPLPQERDQKSRVGPLRCRALSTHLEPYPSRLPGKVAGWICQSPFLPMRKTSSTCALSFSKPNSAVGYSSACSLLIFLALPQTLSPVRIWLFQKWGTKPWLLYGRRGQEQMLRYLLFHNNLAFS